MKNKNIKQIAFTATTALILSACGSGGDNPSADIMVPECGTDTISVNGKTIEKIEDGANVRIEHSPDGEKLACMINGAARIIDN